MENHNSADGISESPDVHEGEGEDPQPSAISDPLDRLFPVLPKPQPVSKQHVQPAAKRQAPKSIATPKGIPNSWEEAGELDRMLVTMRAEGKSWPEVRDAWTAKSGEKPGTSTLPNRFRRIAANLMWGKENMVRDTDVYTVFKAETSHRKSILRIRLPRSRQDSRQRNGPRLPSLSRQSVQDPIRTLRNFSKRRLRTPRLEQRR